MRHILSFEKDLIYIKGELKNNKARLIKQELLQTAVNFDKHSLTSEEIVQAIGEFAAEHQLAHKTVDIILPIKSAVFRVFNLPLRSKPKERLALVKREAETALSNVNDYIIDYLDLFDNADQTCSVQLAAIPKKYIEAYLSALAGLKIKCGKMTLLSNSLLNFSLSYIDKTKPSIVFRINRHNIDFLLISEGACVLPRSLPLSISRFEALNTLDVMAKELAEHISMSTQFLSTINHSSEDIGLYFLCDSDRGSDLIDKLKEQVPYSCSQIGGAANRQLCQYSSAIGGLF